MGEEQVETKSDPEQLRRFMQQVLRDARALEKMLADGCFEEGVTRIGAEQELFLVDAAHRPAPVSLKVLEAIDDPHFTTELASFNLEINLDPIDVVRRPRAPDAPAGIPQVRRHPTGDGVHHLQKAEHTLVDLAGGLQAQGVIPGLLAQQGVLPPNPGLPRPGRSAPVNRALEGDNDGRLYYGIHRFDESP